MTKEHTCTKCKSDCVIDGEYPKFFAWCDTCNDYAEGFDVFKYGAEHMGNFVDHIFDSTYERLRGTLK